MSILRFQNAAVAVGDGEIADVKGDEAIGIQVTIQTTATVVFEGSVDGATWVATAATPVGGGAAVTSATVTGTFKADVTPFEAFRCRISVWVAGTVDAIAHQRS